MPKRKQATLPVGLIGYGYWGPNLLRVLNGTPGYDVRWVCDADPGRLTEARGKFPGLHTEQRAERALTDAEVEAVFIATPADSHATLIGQALQAGKHVYVEKPMTISSAEARTLVDQAKSLGRTLMVGHIFLYNPAVLELAKFVRQGRFGEIWFGHAQRTGAGTGARTDTNIIWDLALHDLYILPFLLQEPIAGVRAVAQCRQVPIPDVCTMVLQFPSGAFVQLHVAWRDPLKRRELSLIGSRMMAHYEEAPERKVSVYNRWLEKRERPTSAAEGSFSLMDQGEETFKFQEAEPLKAECTHFLECLRNGTKPRSDGEQGFEVARVVEAIEESIRNQGKEVIIR